ncbi:MAG: hypothetical protein JRN06_07210 [Nitrososphaerota archaeon]|nr:hypothetical protein [Nitrososphaerota archaeon]MDG7024431.1 hypothetical protein [Nitrososphaerota archaeon]
MPRCARGHEAGLAYRCPTCGADVFFRESLPDLLKLPSPNLKLEDVAVLFVGQAPFDIPGVYTAEAILGKGKPTSKQFIAERLEGGTWLDYNSRYSEQFKRWLRLVGFGKSKHRVLVLDTTYPLAVLAVNNVPLPDNTVVMASVPGAKSTPVAQNSSYATLQLARRRGMHVVLALDSFIAGLAAFTEGKGLATGDSAYEQAIAYILSFVSDLADLTQKDARLGVGAHFFSILLSASDRVFKSVESALEVQLTQTSLEGAPEKVITAHLFATGPSDRQDELRASFERMSSGDHWNLLNAESTVRSMPSSHGLYDVFLLYGVKEPTVLDALRAGYQTVASTAPELSLEGGLSPSPEPPQETAMEVEEEGEERDAKAAPKQLLLMEDFVMARGEMVGLLLQMRGDVREAVLRYQAEVPHDKDPVEGLLATYGDWLNGAFDEFVSSLAEEGMQPAAIQKLCAVAYYVSAVQDAIYSHDKEGKARAEKALQDVKVQHKDLEGLSLVAATDALLRAAEPLFIAAKA